MENALIHAGELPAESPRRGIYPGPSFLSYRKYDTTTLWPSYNAFISLVAGREDLTLDSVSSICCMSTTCLAGPSENMADKIECLPCAQSSTASRLNYCSRCGKLRCHDCVHQAFESLVASSSFQYAMTKTRIWRDGKVGSRADCEALFCEVLFTGNPDRFARCDICEISSCVECMDRVEFEQIARRTVTAAVFGKNSERVEFRCSQCYWKTKPCTNPNCPNEAGIPTKRCGGCHLDRYCSAECQAAAYPEHMERCQKIQAKRALTCEIERKE